jgi:predicted dehydrogenase
VLCEKPLGLSEEECERMIRVCEENDVKLMTAYRLHFEPGNLLAVETLRKGQIGEPRFFSSNFSYQVKDENIRVDREKGGGPLWDIGVYCVNATRYLFREEPTEVFAFDARGDEKRFSEVEEGISAVLKFPGEKLATFNVSFGAARSGDYTVVGTKGSICVEDAYEFTGGKRVELYVGEKLKWSKKIKEVDQVAAELTYFSDCVLEDRAPEPDGREGLADVRIIRALYRSAEERSPVSLEPFKKEERPTREQEITHPPTESPELIAASEPN